LEIQKPDKLFFHLFQNIFERGKGTFHRDKVDRPLRRAMLNKCGCAATLSIEQGIARSTTAIQRH
jgi:hypothetical protein